LMPAAEFLFTWMLVISQSLEICCWKGWSQPLSAACLHIEGERRTEPAAPLGATRLFHSVAARRQVRLRTATGLGAWFGLTSTNVHSSRAGARGAVRLLKPDNVRWCPGDGLEVGESGSIGGVGSTSPPEHGDSDGCTAMTARVGGPVCHLVRHHPQTPQTGAGDKDRRVGL
jgi:hypothetical protein